MTVNRPDIVSTGHYTQAQASRLLGVNRHTLARWEVEGILEGWTLRGRKYYLGRKLLAVWEKH